MEKNTSKLKAKKLSLESTASGSKYKKFLTSFLSPSVSKKHSKKKGKSVLLEERNDSTDRKCRSIEVDQESIESLYSTIQSPEVVYHQASPVGSNETESIDSTPLTQKNSEPNLQVEHPEPNAFSEPVYATVNKTKCDSSVKKSETLSLLQAKENNKLLQERLKELSEENRQLRKQAEDFVKDEKRKEETLHTKLQFEITQLEAETRKEVKTLTDRIHIQQKEKASLNDQIDILHQEKKETQLQCDALREEKRTMVASSHHNKIVEGLRKVLKEATDSRVEAVKDLKQQCDVLEEKNIQLTSQVQELNEKLAAFQMKGEALDHENQKALRENADLLRQIEESKHMEQEGQKLLLSLLKVTENIALERDVLLNKASFQDSQQKELHTTVVDYSLNIGRLQEHISNLNKENVQELLKVKCSRHHGDESINQLHTKQLDILRGKIMEQNTIINEMENEKRQLELQLESVMESSYDKTKMY